MNTLIDQQLMQNIWSLSDTLAERKIRVLSMDVGHVSQQQISIQMEAYRLSGLFYLKMCRS
jgi:hypothetical protein